MRKKRYIAFILVFLLLCQIVFINTDAAESADEPAQLYARSAVLMDADSGRILFGKEAYTARPMASTTKIMTCILALENMEENQIVEASDYAAGQPKVRLGVRGKEKYYLKDILYSLMLESHNDSAVMVAEGIAGTVEEFADLMNEKAKEIGCEDTYFVTPNGLDGYDDGGTHSTTAADLARIMRYCIMQSPEKEAFLEVTRTKSYQFQDIEGKRSFSCSNHNAFLDMMEGALSGKTGFTADAGYCYVGALERDGKTFIVALLACGWPNNKGYKWSDTKALMEYGLANYEYRDLWEDPKLPEILVEDGIDPKDSWAEDSYVNAEVVGGTELKMLLRKDEEVTVETDMETVLQAPVEGGQKVGEVRYLLDDTEVASYPIKTCGGIEKKNLPWCFRKIMLGFCF